MVGLATSMIGALIYVESPHLWAIPPWLDGLEKILIVFDIIFGVGSLIVAIIW